MQKQQEWKVLFVHCTAGHKQKNHGTIGSQVSTLQRHNTETSKLIFLEKELRGLSLNFHIHVYVSDLCIPTIGPPIFLQQNRQTDRGNI
jgi:hypothetical protein